MTQSLRYEIHRRVSHILMTDNRLADVTAFEQAMTRSSTSSEICGRSMQAQKDHINR